MNHWSFNRSNHPLVHVVREQPNTRREPVAHRNRAEVRAAGHWCERTHRNVALVAAVEMVTATRERRFAPEANFPCSLRAANPAL